MDYKCLLQNDHHDLLSSLLSLNTFPSKERLAPIFVDIFSLDQCHS